MRSAGSPRASRATSRSPSGTTTPRLPSATARADALGATVIAYLLTGPAVFGAIGWGVDRLLGTGFVVVLGILGGMALSLYTIWLRYGTT